MSIKSGRISATDHFGSCLLSPVVVLSLWQHVDKSFVIRASEQLELSRNSVSFGRLLVEYVSRSTFRCSNARVV